MKYFENDTASFYYTESVLTSIMKLCLMIKEHPFLIEPVRGLNEKGKAISLSEGFYLYPTVKKTTLFYDKITDCFSKILHPLTLKKKFFFLFVDRARAVYNLSEYFLSKGVKVPGIMAYGLFKKGRRPFFMMKRIEGKPLYDILVRERRILPNEMYLKIVDEVVGVHSLDYRLGDAHLSHIFIKDEKISGFIDIDSIRKNRPSMLKNLAKDLAGLNHPALPLTKNEKRRLLDYYIGKLGIRNGDRFLKLVKYYTERRWKR